MIILKTEREIDLMRKSADILIETFKIVDSLVEPGIRTEVIDQEVEKYIRSRGAKPAFKGYHGYPASACISIDDEVVHGIPGSRTLEVGQIVGIDIGVELNKYFSDAAKTYAVGEISAEKKRLMEVTEASLENGIRAAIAGNRLSDISYAVQSVVEEAGYSVVRELVGHGIGRDLHEDPQVPNYGKPGHGPRLKAGMVLAIEPMVNMGDYEVVFEDDNWTVRTADGSPSAHFEHTIAITEDGNEILTLGR